MATIRRIIDLSDVTFTIPVKIDSAERAENLSIIVRYLLTHFKTQISVFEADTVQRIGHLPKGIDYVFHQLAEGAPFHRTRYLNLMAKNAQTPIIVNYDTDVLFRIEQYVQSADAIRSNQVDGVYPYNGLFLEVPDAYRTLISKELSIDFLEAEMCDVVLGEDTKNFEKARGGAIFWSRQKFIEGGMENENFVSWGPEDTARLLRFQKLGYRIGRADGALYHLPHPRTVDSSQDNPYWAQNYQELERINRATPEELRKEIASWPWCE